MKKITILFLLAITNVCLAGIPIDSVNAWKKQANYLKTDLNTYETIRIYAKAKSLTSIPLDSVNEWKKQAAKDKIDLNTYITGLILLTPSGAAPGTITGTLTANYLPVATGTNTIGNSTSYLNSNQLYFKGDGINSELNLLANTNINAGSISTNASNGRFKLEAKSGYDLQVLNGNTNIYLTSNDIYLSPNGSTALKLNSNGSSVFTSLLDGATSGGNNITHTLSVTGGWRSSYYSTLGYGTELAFFTNNLKKATIFDNYGYTALNSAYRTSIKDINTNQSKFWVDIQNNGFIGIGNDYFTPAYRFHINCGSNEIATLVSDNSTNLVQAIIGGKALFGTTSGHDLQFVTTGSSRLTIKSSGVINITSLPTSAAGLSSGDIWNNAGVLNIVP